MARILIVDDEEADRLLVQAILERAGHETFLAVDGEEALREYALREIDLVVTDLQMPEVHGFELITVLREFAKPPAVVAVSGTGPFQLHMAEALGAKHTLQKPLTPELLLNAANPIRAQGAALADLPFMDRFETDITEAIKTGDEVTVDPVREESGNGRTGARHHTHQEAQYRGARHRRCYFLYLCAA